MFLGEYHRTLDDKGRIFIPSKFREELIKGIVVTKGFNERCLFLFSKDSWKKLQDKIVSLPITKKNIQKFLRWFCSSASEENMDQQGRIKIPQSLIKSAELNKDIVLVGISDRAEIWSKDKWLEYYKSADSEFVGKEVTFEELGF